MDRVEIILGDSRDQQGEVGGEKVGAAVGSPVHRRLGDVLHVEGLEVGDQTIVISPAALDLPGADQETLAPPFQKFEFPVDINKKFWEKSREKNPSKNWMKK